MTDVQKMLLGVSSVHNSTPSTGFCCRPTAQSKWSDQCPGSGSSDSAAALDRRGITEAAHLEVCREGGQSLAAVGQARQKADMRRGYGEAGCTGIREHRSLPSPSFGSHGRWRRGMRDTKRNTK